MKTQITPQEFFRNLINAENIARDLVKITEAITSSEFSNELLPTWNQFKAELADASLEEIFQLKANNVVIITRDIYNEQKFAAKQKPLWLKLVGTETLVNKDTNGLWDLIVKNIGDANRGKFGPEETPQKISEQTQKAQSLINEQTDIIEFVKTIDLFSLAKVQAHQLIKPVINKVKSTNNEEALKFLTEQVNDILAPLVSTGNLDAVKCFVDEGFTLPKDTLNNILNRTKDQSKKEKIIKLFEEAPKNELSEAPKNEPSDAQKFGEIASSKNNLVKKLNLIKQYAEKSSTHLEDNIDFVQIMNFATNKINPHNKEYCFDYVKYITESKNYDDIQVIDGMNAILYTCPSDSAGLAGTVACDYWDAFLA